MNNWYTIHNQLPDTGSVEIYIDNEIGEFGVSARSFLNELKQYEGRSVNLHINSPGGSLVDAFAIYDFVKLKGFDITAHISGIAASAATVISAAAGKVLIGAHSYYYIHNPYYAGDSAGPGENLDKMKASLLDIYEAKTGLSRQQLSDMMDAETLLTAKEAMEYGFVDGVTNEVLVAARIQHQVDQLPEAQARHLRNLLPGHEQSNIWKQLLQTLQGFEQRLSREPIASLDMPLIDGGTLTISNRADYSEVLPGDSTKAEDGQYQLANGHYLEVQGGIIENIFKQTDIMNNTEALSAKIEELITQLQQMLAQMKPEGQKPPKDQSADAEIANLTRELERIKARRLDVANNKPDADPDQSGQKQNNGWNYVSRYMQTRFN